MGIRKDELVTGSFDLTLSGNGDMGSFFGCLNDEDFQRLSGRLNRILEKAGFEKGQWDFSEPEVDGVELGVGVGAEDVYTFVDLYGRGKVGRTPGRHQGEWLNVVGSCLLSDAEDKWFYHLSVSYSLSEEMCGKVADSIRSGEWEKKCGFCFVGMGEKGSKVEEFLERYGERNAVKESDAIPVEIDMSHVFNKGKSLDLS